MQLKAKQNIKKRGVNLTIMEFLNANLQLFEKYKKLCFEHYVVHISNAQQQKSVVILKEIAASLSPITCIQKHFSKSTEKYSPLHEK